MIVAVKESQEWSWHPVLFFRVQDSPVAAAAPLLLTTALLRVIVIVFFLTMKLSSAVTFSYTTKTLSFT